MRKILEEILEICNSDELHKTKVDMIYELSMKGLGIDQEIPTSQELLKMGKMIIRKEKLSISNLKINKDGDFEFLVYVSSGCHGDWCDWEVLSPFLFYQKIVKPYQK